MKDFMFLLTLDINKKAWLVNLIFEKKNISEINGTLSDLRVCRI